MTLNQVSYFPEEFSKQAIKVDDCIPFEKTPKISIVIPCYNEEETIGQVIDKINGIGLEDFEIIIVDDGSKDASPEIISSKDNTKLYIHKKNQGYGKTLLDGIRKATGDLIVTIDSDGQHDPNDIPILCEPIIKSQADLVVGSRYSGKYYYQVPFTNRAGEAFIETLMMFIFGKSVKNNQGGMRVFHRKTLSIFDEVKFMDMAFTTEILMIAFIKGFRVVEGPIHLKDRPVGASRVKKLRLLADIFHCFAYYSLEHMKKRYNLKYPIFQF